jgi:glyoxylase-like metal-dependent hydrolase (beta-lactamase superfamily II)
MSGITRRELLQTAAASAVPARKLFEMQEAAKNCYLALAEPAAVLNCNSPVFVERGGIVVVDTHSKPSAARALIRQIREEIADLPIRHVIVTHFHYDHSQGTAAFASLAPRPEIHATEDNARLLREQGAARAAKMVESARKRTDNPELQAFVREMEGYEPVIPDETFRGRSLAGSLQLFVPGRGHTASDLCCWNPAARVLAVADLVVGFVPGMDDGYPLEWPATLDTLDRTPFDILLSGHGPVQHGHDRLRQQKAYIEELIARCREMKSRRLALEDAQAALTPDRLASYDHGGYGEFVHQTMARYRPLAPGEVTNAVRAGVAANVAAVWRALG